jgi:hypothetical protein
MQRLLLNEDSSHSVNGLTKLGYNVEGDRPDNYIVCDGGSHGAKVPGVNQKSGQEKRREHTQEEDQGKGARMSKIKCRM